MSRKHVSLALQAVGWLAVVEWQRRRCAFDTLVRRLEGRPVGPRSSIAATTARSAVRRVSRLLPLPASCLRDSLAAVALLRSLGYPARLAIGVKDSSGPIEAHAWVEVEGVAAEAEVIGYRRMERSGG